MQDLDGWPEKVKLMQQNWIGKSEGMNFSFRVKDSDETINVFTTRPDTIMGVSFIAISSSHRSVGIFQRIEKILKAL